MAGMNPQFSDSQFMPGCPRCPHGPMLALLNTQSPSDRFACSAFRNKADCGKDARLQNGSRLHWSVNELLKAAPGDRGYCIECDCLYRCSITSRHVAHKTQIGLTDDLLRMPSFLLKPMANSSGHAYFFSLESLNHLYSIFCQVGAQFVLCIGSPRMHEFIQLQRTHRSQPMDSHLLDMDFRLKSFYGEKFSRYNMVNGFLFTPTDDSCFQSFCTRAKELSKCVLFCDPPFASPLCLILKQMDSLRSLLSDRNCDKVMNKKPSAGSGRNLTPIFFVLPYFFEHKLQKMAPFFALLDYKIL
ncbi:unnamed protein product [Calicophoron daubneyi]|uniref:Uncharacterized protein n=1 Tax=Calicophoron daubneyi TaxID=300641 RepID=A0AAV2TRS2_CALDB